MATQFLTGAATNTNPAPVQATPVATTPTPTATNNSSANAGGQAFTPTPAGLDSTVVNLAKAIRQQESGGDYAATGKDGEIGAYQFTPATWSAVAPKYGIQTPLNSSTPEEQNAAAYNYILDLKNKGYNPVQIASIWNSGNPDPNHAGQGTSAGGASYNTPQYATNVYNLYNQYKGQETDAAGVAPQTPTLPTDGATFANNPNDNILVSGLKALGNIPSSLYGVGAGLVNIVSHPIQTAENLGSSVIGGVENLTGSNPGNPDQFQNQANNLGQAIMQRYGSLDALKNTMVNDPAGFALDLATLVTGGEGLAAKGADLADLATGGREAQAASNLAYSATTGLNVMPQHGTYGTMARNAIDAMNTATMSTLGKAASPITALPSRIINSLVGGGVSEDVLNASQRTGIDLPAAAYTRNPLVNSAEAIAATGGGEAAYTARVDTTLSKMGTLADKIIASTGGETDPVNVGNSIAKGAEELAKIHEDAIGELYKGLEKTAGDVAAKTESTTAALNKIISDQEALGETTNVNYFKNKLDVLNGAKTDKTGLEAAKADGVEFLDSSGNALMPEKGKYKAPTYSTLKELRTLLGKKIKNFSDPIAASNKQDLIKMYASLSQDMRSTLLAQKDGAQLAATWDKANVAFGDHMDEITSQYAKTIRRLAENGQESKIVSSLIKPSTALEDIPRIMEIAGQEGAANIRATFVKQILDNSKDPVTGNFTAGKIEKEMAKYQKNGSDRVAAILKPEQIQQLQDLGKLADGMKTVMQLQKGASSQFLVKMALQLKTLGEPAAGIFGAYKIMTGDVVGGLSLLGGVVGFEGISRFLASDLGNEVLKWGALHGTEFSKVAKSVGLTDNSNIGTINPYENNEGATSVPGTNDVATSNSDATSVAVPATGDLGLTESNATPTPIPEGGISPSNKKVKK